jgi:hypothetical protein
MFLNRNLDKIKHKKQKIDSRHKILSVGIFPPESYSTAKKKYVLKMSGTKHKRISLFCLTGNFFISKTKSCRIQR